MSMVLVKLHFFSFYIGYVQTIYETFLDAQRKDTLEEEAKKIKKMTPEPMNTMLNKQSRDEAKKSNGCEECPSNINRFEKSMFISTLQIVTFLLPYIIFSHCKVMGKLQIRIH